ncbi:Benzyl alcohol O-benzoyltransferase, partial [Mucuna pruriens]
MQASTLAPLTLKHLISNLIFRKHGFIISLSLSCSLYGDPNPSWWLRLHPRTPRELKPLSDIDGQQGLRVQIPLVQFCGNEPSMEGKDPVNVIRHALAQTLVFYYPFAGRLREGPGCKLMVDCTGDDVLFIEADADVTLHQFGDALQPPFPCFQELLYDVPASEGIINSPPFTLSVFERVEVTRLKWGGFIVAILFNHSMSDGAGMAQFMNALAEIAGGACKLIRSLVPHLLCKCTTFDVITACIWRCRTKALQIKTNKDVPMMCVVNARARFNPPLPIGYYGNAIAYQQLLLLQETHVNMI